MIELLILLGIYLFIGWLFGICIMAYARRQGDVIRDKDRLDALILSLVWPLGIPVILWIIFSDQVEEGKGLGARFLRKILP